MMSLAPAIAIIKEFEGCELSAYQDGGGIWTIGYGHTRGVTEGMVISQAQADAFLAQDIQMAAEGVLALVKVPLTDNEFCALVSFDYNEGFGNLRSSTLLRLLNYGVPKETVAEQFARWDLDSKGQVEPGLIRRRQAEKELFLKPD